MSIRDFQASFTDTSTINYLDITGAAGTYIAANSYDTSPLGASLTELTAADTTLSANTNTYRELGGGERIWLVVDWITAATSGTNADVQLVTSSTSALGSPVVIYDFGAVVTASLVKGFRQIAALPRTTLWKQWLGLQVVTTGTYATGQLVAWLAKDIDAVNLGAASGFSIK
jgi:hypothetical protein